MQYRLGRVSYISRNGADRPERSEPRQPEPESIPKPPPPSQDHMDAHLKMSQKITELTKEVTQLTAKNDKADQHLQTVTMSYESEVELIVKDADAQINKAANEAAESAYNATRAQLASFQERLEEERREAQLALQRLREETNSRERETIRVWSERFRDLNSEMEAVQMKSASQANAFKAELQRRDLALNSMKALHAEELATVRASQSEIIAEARASMAASTDNGTVERMKEAFEAEKASREKLQQQLNATLAEGATVREQDERHREKLEVELRDCRIEVMSMREDARRCKAAEEALQKAKSEIQNLQSQLDMQHRLQVDLEDMRKQNRELLEQVQSSQKTETGGALNGVGKDQTATRREVQRREVEHSFADAAVDAAVQAARSHMEELRRLRSDKVRSDGFNATSAPMDTDESPNVGRRLQVTATVTSPAAPKVQGLMTDSLVRSNAGGYSSPVASAFDVDKLSSLASTERTVQVKPPAQQGWVSERPQVMPRCDSREEQPVDLAELRAAHARLLGMATRGFSMARSLSTAPSRPDCKTSV